MRRWRFADKQAICEECKKTAGCCIYCPLFGNIFFDYCGANIACNFYPLTHTVTNTGKRAGRIGENIRPNYFTISELKRPKRSGKGWSNVPSAAHNRSVVGSNPSPAAIKDCTFVYHDKSAVFSCFRTKSTQNGKKTSKTGLWSGQHGCSEAFFSFTRAIIPQNSPYIFVSL